MLSAATEAQRETYADWKRSIHCNAGGGGPPPIQRRQRIKSSLLGNNEGEIRCPQFIRLGFELSADDDPLDMLQALLADRGFASPEELRDEFIVPGKPYICRPAERKAPWPCPRGSSDRNVLRHALLLGLCTAQVYDPRRPVIWTRSSLMRRIDLFDPTGFYAS